MEIIINIFILLFFPLLFIGIINKTKAVWGGRKGASIIQPFFNFIKLLKKGEVISHTASFVFRISPSIIFSSVLIAALFVPLTGHKAIINFNYNFILFAYALGAGKFFSLISAMDVGNSFEGMGASREAAFTSMVETAFFIITASLATLMDNFSMSTIFKMTNHHEQIIVLSYILAMITLFLIILIEGFRIPVDDPDTHLELTMIHEVMILDNSGPDLALILYSSAMKMVIIASLIANLIIPENTGLFLSTIMLLIILFIISIAIGTLESVVARFRLRRIPEFIFVINSAALIIFFSILLYNFRGIR